MNLVGIGQDSHRFLKEKNIKDLILGGIKIDFEYGLEGNSDADVIIHSLCNAISSALGGGSISTWTNEMCKNGIEDSSQYLLVILEKMKNMNCNISNISISIEAKEPKLENIIGKIKNNLSKILNIDTKRMGITATSGEGLTDFGRGLGIQALSIVNLISNES